MSSRNPYEKYEIKVVKRSEIKQAEYNPRFIPAKNLKKLKNNIQKMGVLQPFLVNGRNNVLIGGHQRIRILDDLMNADGLAEDGHYPVTIAVADMDEKSERELNIFLNNSTAQGEFDTERLVKLYREDKLDYDATGFDKQFLGAWLGDSIFDDNPTELQEIADRYRQIGENHKKSIEKLDARDDPHFMTRVIFRDSKQRNEMCASLGIEDPEFVNGEWFYGLASGKRPRFAFVCDFCGVEQYVPSEATGHLCEACGILFPVDWTQDPPAAPEVAAEPTQEVIDEAAKILQDDGRFAPPSK